MTMMLAAAAGGVRAAAYVIMFYHDPMKTIVMQLHEQVGLLTYFGIGRGSFFPDIHP